MKRAASRAAAHWPAWLNATVLLLASVITVAALSFQVRPGAEIVAVAFPPWWSTQRIYEAAASANAAIVRTTAIAAVVVVRPDDREGIDRLRKAGAWLTIDPQAVAACFNRSDRGI